MPSTLAEKIAKIRERRGGPSKGLNPSPAAPSVDDGFSDPGNFKQRQQRARRRLARVRLADPKALRDIKPTARGNYTRSQRKAILEAVKALNKKQKAQREKAAENNYNPLAPLVGKDMKRELDAAERLRFGSEEAELKKAMADHDNQTGLIGAAHDAYAKALTDATARINASYGAAADATQKQVDDAYAQDKKAHEDREKAENAKGAKFGFAPTSNTDGAKAVEAARSQGNQTAGAARTLGASANQLMEERGAYAVQGKTEALGRQSKRRDELVDARKALEREKGDFRVAHRSELRGSEREWAAIQKEFGLKEREMLGNRKDRAADRKLEQQKLAAQKIIARLYSSADKASARAQIRVARLQLEKGKINQHQYRHIINEYRGLPKKKHIVHEYRGLPKKGKGKGSGTGGAWAPWERQRIDRGAQSLMDKKAGLGDREKAIQTLVRNGYSRALANATWRAYVKRAKLTKRAKLDQNLTGG